MAPTVGLLQYKETQIYNEKIHSSKLCLLGEDLGLLAMSSLVWSFGYLPQILSVHIYKTRLLVNVCMPL